MSCIRARALLRVAASAWLAAAVACGPSADPEASRAAIERGIEKIKRGQLAESLSDFAQAVDLDPGSSEAHSVYGAALERSQQLEAARARYAEAARIDPHSRDPRLHLARLDQLLELDARIARAAAAAANAPGSAALHTATGDLLLQRRRAKPAQLHYLHALRLEPGSPRALSGLGRAYVAVGREAEAIAYLSEALTVDEGSAAASDEITWVLATSRNETLRDLPAAIRRAEAAILRIESASAPGPPRPRLLDALAAAYARSGRFDEAVATGGAALQQAQNAGLHLYAAQIRRRVDRYAGGRAFTAPGPVSG